MRYHKLRSFFKTIENNLCKLLFKPKDWVATNDKSSIAYECNCSNSKTFYFGESKRSLKSCSDEDERSVRNGDCKKNEISKNTTGKHIATLAGIRRKLLIEKAG